jgi:hypothetical protein
MERTEFIKSIESMAAQWPSSIVARKSIAKFSGGTLSPKTMANEDCNGTGPVGSFLLANQVVYPVESLIAWLKLKSAKSWADRKSVQ